MSANQPLEPNIAHLGSIQALKNLQGTELGPTQWHEITQQSITAFSVLTGDQQWIHVDPERARDSSFGSTIAHGLYTLSRGAAFVYELMSFDGFAHTLNYGYEKVRFPAPVPVGSRIRMRATIASVEEVSDGHAHVVMKQVFEREHSQKPVCVAQSVSRFIEHPTASEA